MKDFDQWNKLKKNINSKESITCNEREIWWASLGLNIGYEQDGKGEDYKRPVVILKNINRVTCFIVPLTTSPKSNAYRVPLGKIKRKDAWAAISQLRVIDTKRLRNRMGALNRRQFEKIRKAAKENI